MQYRILHKINIFAFIVSNLLDLSPFFTSQVPKPRLDMDSKSRVLDSLAELIHLQVYNWFWIQFSFSIIGCYTIR